MPVEDGSADVVVSFETIEHLADQRGVPRRGRQDPAARRAAASSPRPTARRSRGEEANPFHVRELDRTRAARAARSAASPGSRSGASARTQARRSPFRQRSQSPAGRVVLRPRRPRHSFHGSAELPAPVYLIALATNGPLPEAGPSTLFDSHYLPRLHRRLEELERDAPARREELLATYAREQALDGARREPRRCASACSPRSSRG